MMKLKILMNANPSAFTRPDDVVKLQLIVITSGNQAKLILH